MRTTKRTARTEQATTPTGEPGIRLECTDPSHRHHGAAIIRHTDSPIDAERACKLIDVAHHPFLSRAASTRRFGPWAV